LPPRHYRSHSHLMPYTLSQCDREESFKFAILLGRKAHGQNRKFNGTWRHATAPRVVEL